MMKKSTIPLISRFVFVLALLGTFSTSMAYDFEVDGIYYNKTSNNTVEVTYKDKNYGSYTDDITIPSSISVNVISSFHVNYTVTSVGDSAFFACDLRTITLPETILSIGECAFFQCSPFTMTCLAIEAPSLNNSFDCDGDWRFDYWFKDDCYVLYVNPNAFDNYSGSEWLSHFNFMLKTNNEKTSSESVSINVNERFSRYDGRFLHAEISVSYNSELAVLFVGNDGGWDVYSGEDIWVDEYGGCSISAILVEFGKLPSDDILFSYNAPEYAPECYYDDYYYPYQIIVDSICYRRINENSVAVSPDVDVTTHYPHGDSEINCHGFYNGYLTIPSIINYDGNTFNVTSIDSYTFGTYGEYGNLPEGKRKSNLIQSPSLNYESYYSTYYFGYVDGRNLTSIVLPNSITSIDYAAFYDCINLSRITIPNSVTHVGMSAFEGCNNIQLINLTGDGAWAGASLDVSVQRLDIASGITAVPGLKVNPREVYCFATVPPTCDENTFTDYTGTLHVPESSLAAYFTAPYWSNFLNIVGDAVELTDLTLSVDSAELIVDEELSLDATLQPANASAGNIVWTSSDENIATVVDGVVTAKAKGECDIIVTCLGKQAVCHVKVLERVINITLDQHRATLLPNHIMTLTPSVTPVSTELVVTSSDPSVAAARLANGNVQVVGVAPGYAVIKVASADGNAFADSCIVNVCNESGRFYPEDFTISPGMSCNVSIILDNEVPYTAFQTDIFMPEGLTIEQDDGDYIFDLTSRKSRDHIIASQSQANGSIRVICYSPHVNAFIDSDGPLVTFNVTASPNFEGPASISLCNTLFTTTSGLEVPFNDETCVVTVLSAGVQGDVNGDGILNISDVTTLIDYLLNSNDASIDLENSDVTGDGTINISDVTAIIDMLLRN